MMCRYGTEDWVVDLLDIRINWKPAVILPVPVLYVEQLARKMDRDKAKLNKFFESSTSFYDCVRIRA
jgi:hypothetical protein